MISRNAEYTHHAMTPGLLFTREQWYIEEISVKDLVNAEVYVNSFYLGFSVYFSHIWQFFLFLNETAIKLPAYFKG